MKRHQKRGIGSVIIGTMTLGSFLHSATMVSPYAALGVIGGLSLLVIGIMQFSRPEQFTTDQPPSRRRQVTVFGLAIDSFVGGWLYAVA